MRRIFKILFVVGFALLILYAFVEPVRGYMQTNWGPPLSKAFGSIYTSITTSPLWLMYVAKPLNAFIIGMIFMIPIALLWHRSYNRVRTRFVRSAAMEAGAQQQVMTRPVSQPSYTQPVPVAAPVKQETSPPPPPPPTETTTPELPQPPVTPPESEGET